MSIQKETILRSLPELRASGRFADVVLHVEPDSKSYYCHRCLLVAAGNKYLREILADQDDDVIHIYLPDFNHAEVNEVLNVVYCVSNEIQTVGMNRFFKEFFKDVKDTPEESFKAAAEDFNASSDDERKEWLEPRVIMKAGDEEFLWKCTECPRGEHLQFNVWVKHINRKGIKVGRNICECCGKDWKEKEVLMLHNLNIPCLRNTKNQKSFRCQICPYQSFGLRSLQNHVFLQHGDQCQTRLQTKFNGYSCEICHSIIHTVESFSEHQVKIHGIDPKNFTSSYEKCYKEYWKIYDPIFQELNDKESEKDEEINVKGWIYCAPCHKGFSERTRFNIHVKAHEPFQCKFCSCRLQTIHEYHDHRRGCVGPLKCSGTKCDATFQTRNEVRKHLAEEHDESIKAPQYEKVIVKGRKMLKCDKCAKVFPTNQRVNRHKDAMHLDKSLPKKFKCDFESCNYVTNVSASLYSHRMIHKPPTHFCHICGHGSRNGYDMRRHMDAKHQDGNANILCAVCGKVFDNPVTLERHLDGHKATHSCKICEKTFNWKSSLRSHLRFAHSTERNFVCEFPGCIKTFKVNSHLKRHQKGHK